MGCLKKLKIVDSIIKVKVGYYNGKIKQTINQLYLISSLHTNKSYGQQLSVNLVYNSIYTICNANIEGYIYIYIYIYNLQKK